MPEQTYAKPLPSPSPETRFFWEKLRSHELWLPWCRACEKFYWYPRDFCPECGSRDVEWRRSTGRGKIYTFAIHYRAWHPGWADEVPYATVLVDMDEGVRLFSNLIGIDADPKTLRCDVPVEVVFEDVTPEMTLFKFRPASE